MTYATPDGDPRHNPIAFLTEHQTQLMCLAINPVNPWYLPVGNCEVWKITHAGRAKLPSYVGRLIKDGGKFVGKRYGEARLPIPPLGSFTFFLLRPAPGSGRSLSLTSHQARTK